MQKQPLPNRTHINRTGPPEPLLFYFIKLRKSEKLYLNVFGLSKESCLIQLKCVSRVLRRHINKRGGNRDERKNFSSKGRVRQARQKTAISKYAGTNR